MYKIVLSLLVLICASCSKEENQRDSRQVTLNLSGPIQSYDCRQVNDIPSFILMKMLYEGLTRLEKGDQVVPALAQTIEQEGLRYIFTLKDSQWSNGEKVTAYDFEYSWKSQLDPQFPSPVAQAFYPIKNAREVKRGDLPQTELGIKAINEKQLEVELSYNAPHFLYLTALPPFFPVYKEMSSEENWGEKAMSVVCNGPFSIYDVQNHNKISLQKNPWYHEKKEVKLDFIDLLMLDGTNELELFENGDLDWAGSPLGTLPTDAIDSLQKKGEIKLSPSLATSYLFFQTEKKPLDNKKFRQALSVAIEREKICEHLLKNLQKPAYGFLPPSIQINAPQHFQKKIAAKQVFEEALAEMGIKKEELEPITLNYTLDERTHKIAQALQEQWNEAFGINVTLNKMERKTFFSKRAAGEYQICISNWFGDYPDPMNFLEIFEDADSSSNHSFWEDSVYQDLLLLAKEEQDPLKRRSLLGQAEEILIEEAPIAPIFHFNMAYLKNKNLKNTFISSLGHLDFRNAYISEEE